MNNEEFGELPSVERGRSHLLTGGGVLGKSSHSFSFLIYNVR